MAGFYLIQLPDVTVDHRTDKWGEIKPYGEYDYVFDLWRMNATFGHISIQHVCKSGTLNLELQCSNMWNIDVVKEDYPKGVWFNVPDNSESLEASDETKTIVISTTPKLEQIRFPICRYVRFHIKNTTADYAHFLIHLVGI
jgi:hypothetical protein|nr:MAG TPA: hypothetical protein [Caudoviricetes sp.]